MENRRLHLVYFSPTGTTKAVLRTLLRYMGKDRTEVFEYDLTNVDPSRSLPRFEREDIVLFGLPVYSGRVPGTFQERLANVTGDGTAAAIVATYGNREYEDALLEMKDIAVRSGFLPVAAAAVVTEHSVIRAVAKGRPDAKDAAFLKEFGKRLTERFEEIGGDGASFDLALPGKAPYRRYRKIPMAPVANARCTKCGACVKQCPVGAIDPLNPVVTDAEACIGCMRCVRLCPVHARHVPKIKMVTGNVLLLGARWVRKEPEMFF